MGPKLLHTTQMEQLELDEKPFNQFKPLLTDMEQWDCRSF